MPAVYLGFQEAIYTETLVPDISTNVGNVRKDERH